MEGNISLLIWGMAAFLGAQILRAIRWQILLPSEAKVRKNQLLLYVSLGSLINIFLPFRLGDMARACLLTSKTNVRIAVSLSSLIIERLTDILALILILSLLGMLLPGQDFIIRKSFTISIILALLVYFSLKDSTRVRKIIFKISSIWNDQIQNIILDLFWTYSLQIKQARYASPHYIFLSLLMWCLYSSAYYLFYRSIAQFTLEEAWILFHGNPFSGMLTFFREPSSIEYVLVIFLATPVLCSLTYSMLYSIFNGTKRKSRFFQLVSRNGSYDFLRAPSLFTHLDPYSNFLKSYFSKEKNLLNAVGVDGFKDCRITRVFSGGSDAITAIVENSDHLTIRKVTSANLSKRHHEQYDWLKRNSNKLPVVSTSNWTELSTFCFYEMPYEVGSVDLFEWIHAVPKKLANDTLLKIIENISHFHKSATIAIPRQDLLKIYIETKVQENIIIAKEEMALHLNIYSFKINNELFSMSEWDKLFTIDNVLSIIHDTYQTDIHGDLTIENIIIDRSQNWFLIDPNPSSVYKTKLMDIGKILQSLHLGYEFMARGVDIKYSESSISFINKRSDRYEDLYKTAINQIKQNYGEDGLKEALYHEIIHYLRLLPYKIKRGGNQGLIFFCATCILIRNFTETYGDN